MERKERDWEKTDVVDDDSCLFNKEQLRQTKKLKTKKTFEIKALK